MNDVEITGPGTVTGEKDENGTTYYGWSFPVVVNGQAGVVTIWGPTNDPADEPAIEELLLEFLEDDPSIDSDLGGISENDPGTDPGDLGDFIDDDGGFAFASNDGGDYGDSA